MVGVEALEKFEELVGIDQQEQAEELAKELVGVEALEPEELVGIDQQEQAEELAKEMVEALEMVEELVGVDQQEQAEELAKEMVGVVARRLVATRFSDIYLCIERGVCVGSQWQC